MGDTKKLLATLSLPLVLLLSACGTAETTQVKGDLSVVGQPLEGVNIDTCTSDAEGASSNVGIATLCTKSGSALYEEPDESSPTVGSISEGAYIVTQTTKRYAKIYIDEDTSAWVKLTPGVQVVSVTGE